MNKTIAEVQAENSAPFDSIASDYDRNFSERTLGRWLREATWLFLAEIYSPGDDVLDLGCGTGQDACMLARRGVFVTAVDQSQRMLEFTAQRAAREGVADHVNTRQLDLSTWSREDLPDIQRQLGRDGFDGAYSNFGALNCLEDLSKLADVLAVLIREGGRLLFVVMGPICLWEIFWHLRHGKPRTAFRRTHGGAVANAGQGELVRVWYPSPSRLYTIYQRDFRWIHTVAVGAFLPPSYLANLVDRYPGAFRRLERLEDRTRQLPILPNLSDHYLVVFERK